MANAIDAITSINSNAKVITRGSDIDTMEIDWLNGTSEISKADIKTKLTELNNKEAVEASAKENKKASGKQKLKDLGLDDDEIQALIGV
jgi:hypothetical protein